MLQPIKGWKSSCHTCISSSWACNWKYHHLLSMQLLRNDLLCDELLLLSLGPGQLHNSCKTRTFFHILVALILPYFSSPPSSLLPFLSAHKIWNFKFHYFDNSALSGRNKVNKEWYEDIYNKYVHVQPQPAWILLCFQPRISLVSSLKPKGRARKQWGACSCGNKHNFESCPFSFPENWVESAYNLKAWELRGRG